ncbi:MAG: cupin domain-containing protein [Pirellulaceae bacterium]|nr:cupin domain-containing protein [Pirellulaceae bacterium]
MKVTPADQVEEKIVDMPGAHGCSVRWLVSESDGAPNFAMRQFEVAPGGYTPRHSHPYEHEVYVLQGQGTVLDDDQERPLKTGDVVLVRPDEIHQFRNTGEAPMRFLCLVPNSSATLPVTLAPECGSES